MSRRTWYWLIVVAAAISCGGQAAAAAPPPTAFVTLTPIADDDPQTDDRAWATSNINAVSIKQGALVSAGDYQFTTYYGADGKLNLARRNRADRPGRWDIRRTQFTSYNLEDRHNTSSAAIDGAGRLHVAWGMHGGGPLLYSRSTASVLNDAPWQLSGDQLGNAGAMQQEVPLQNDTNAITYPQFWNIPDSGDLLLTFRVGAAGNGEWQLVRWDNAAAKWRSVHTAIGSTDDSPRQPWIDNDYAGDDLPNTNAYHNGLAFDDAHRIHLTWSWRTGGDSPSGFGDFQSNHHLMYAYSDDMGESWRRADGQPYRRRGRHDIDEANATPVVAIAEGSSIINQSSSTTGPDGRYYMATYWAPRAAEGNHLRQYMLTEYDGADWRTHQVTDRQSENENARIPESRLKLHRMSRPLVLTDPDNRVLLVFCDHQRGGVVTIASSDDPAREEWQFIDLTDQPMGLWEPRHDPVVWARDGVLNLYYQPCGLGRQTEPVAVLQWDARAYFASRAEH